jgi:hypothetical protein
MKYWTFEVEKYGLVLCLWLDTNTFLRKLFWGYLIGIQYMMYQRKKKHRCKTKQKKKKKKTLTQKKKNF